MRGRKVPQKETIIKRVGHGATVITADGSRQDVNVYTGLLPDESIPVSAKYARIAQPVNDLNDLRILNHDGRAMDLNTPVIEAGATTVYFRDIEAHLLRHINESDAILGCVAWLTSKSILSALAQKDPVSLIVQKEDFLRPDLDGRNGWTRELRRRYDALRCTWERWDLGLWLSTSGDQTMSPVRCVGNYNRDKKPAFPRMHHKFIIFHRHTTRREKESCVRSIEPYAVWTGSFNFTENAGHSLENALLITNRDIVDAYVDEWERVASISEPLDWESDWVAPEWRIGT